MKARRSYKQEKSERKCNRILASEPDNPTAHFDLGVIALKRGNVNLAIQRLLRAIDLDPNQPNFYNVLGIAYETCGHVHEGAHCFQKTLNLDPDNAEAHNNLGNNFQYQGKWAEAVSHFQKAITLGITLVDTHIRLGCVLCQQNDPEGAVASFRNALKIDPDHSDAHSNLLLTLNYLHESSGENLYQESLLFDIQHARRLLPAAPSFKNTRGKDKALRVGYVSSDFRSHSVAHFILKLFGAHNRDRVAVFCYANVAKPDGVTQMLQAQADHWYSIAGIQDEEVARKIRKDKIDILIDLAGHTSDNRLLLFARKPAPIQVNWLGYPNTTGMSAIDYRFTDSVADPPGEADSLHSETLIRLPHGFLCYQTDSPIPEEPKPPCLKRGYVTFGSFNNFVKTTPEVFRIWAKIFALIPNARLVLKSRAMADESMRAKCLQMFLAHGIAPERLDMFDWVLPRKDHLEAYSDVDISLDPFPYNGATTTCEALWMGVPVITLRGNRHAGRVGASIMHHVGLPELIAENLDEYVEKAVSLANDPKRLVHLRKSLRPQMRNSSLMNIASFTKSIEDAYREIWTNWCDKAQT